MIINVGVGSLDSKGAPVVVGWAEYTAHLIQAGLVCLQTLRLLVCSLELIWSVFGCLALSVLSSESLQGGH